MKSDRNQLLEGGIARALFSLAAPIIAVNVLQTGYQLTDAFWVGRLGASAVAAVAVSFPITFLVIAMGSGLAMAGAVLCAQYAGARKQDMVDHVAAQTMLMVILTSVVLASAGYIASPYFLSFLGVAPDVAKGALGFMRISFIGIIFVFTYAMFQALMRGIGQTTLPLVIVFATVVLNFGLDPLFIFGFGPISAHGVVGAALATLITQALASIAGIAIFLRGRHGIRLRWAALRPDPKYLRRAFLLGFPASIELSTRALGMTVMSFLVASFGTLPIAIYGVGSTIIQVVTIPAMGLSMAVSTLVGQSLGAENPGRASRVAVLGICYGFGLLTVIGLICYFAAPSIVAFFVPEDPAVISGGAVFVRIMCLAFGGIGIQLSTVAAFRASGNMLTAMVIALVSQWVVQFPVAYILSEHTALGADGLWWSFPVMNVISALVALAWFARGDWQKGNLTAESKQITRVANESMIEEGLK